VKKMDEAQKKEAARLAAEAAKQPPQEVSTRRVVKPGDAPPPAQTPVAATTTTTPPPANTPAPATNTPAATGTTATATSANSYLGGKAAVGGLIPAASAEEAKTDPRFAAGALVEDARVKVVSVADKYPYFGIANNGCSSGRSFVTAELISPFDGLTVGVPVVLRIEDPNLGPARAGSFLAFSGLRRAGKAPDGTFVYCGKGTAFPVRR